MRMHNVNVNLIQVGKKIYDELVGMQAFYLVLIVL